MNHEVIIVESRQVSGLIAVAAVCCGDQSTKSWHSMAPAILDDPARFEQSVSGHLQRVAGHHENMLQAKTILSGMVGQTHAFDKHSVKFAHYKQLSDGQLSVGAHCCGDDSTLTHQIMDSSTAADPIICQKALNGYFQTVANQHETTQRCMTELPGLVGRQYKTTGAVAATAVPVSVATVNAPPQQVGVA